MLKLADRDGLLDRIVGASPQTQRLRQQAHQLACCNVSLLLQGESGVGKELLARTIHGLSPRRDGPFVGVNCAAIHESLMESELFGHVAGAFTGADKSSVGCLRAADGGTILLDEVGDMSKSLQSKLLRVLEERTVVPVGGTREIPIDVRVISATNRDLSLAVQDGLFRMDLLYRLNVVTLDIPPLRHRRDDIVPLVESFLVGMADLLDVPARSMSPEALEIMVRYDWPGNVRELGNVIQRAYALGHDQTGAIVPADLPRVVRNFQPSVHCEDGTFLSLDQATRRHVEQALQVSDGVRSKAARLLGIDRKSLWRMMKRYSIA